MRELLEDDRQLEPSGGTPTVPAQEEFPKLRRFSVDEYHKLIQHHILAEGEAVELLDGLLVQKMPRNAPHECVSDLLEGLLLAVIPAEWFLRAQRAITLETSEPEPDFAIVQGPHGRYAQHHPRASEIGLLIEVADTSLRTDRSTKADLYAEAGIPIYWVINIPERCVEVYSQPTESGYQHTQRYTEADQLPVILNQVQVGTISVSALLPSASEATP